MSGQCRFTMAYWGDIRRTYDEYAIAAHVEYRQFVPEAESHSQPVSLQRTRAPLIGIYFTAPCPSRCVQVGLDVVRPRAAEDGGHTQTNVPQRNIVITKSRLLLQNREFAA